MTAIKPVDLQNAIRSAEILQPGFGKTEVSSEDKIYTIVQTLSISPKTGKKELSNYCWNNITTSNPFLWIGYYLFGMNSCLLSLLKLSVNFQPHEVHSIARYSPPINEEKLHERTDLRAKGMRMRGNGSAAYQTRTKARAVPEKGLAKKPVRPKLDAVAATREAETSQETHARRYAQKMGVRIGDQPRFV